MSVIADVYSCCKQLTATVVKTRKEALASLLRHLELDKTRTHLDEVSADVLSGRLPEPSLELDDFTNMSEGAKARLYRHLSWNKVVHAVVSMVELEAKRTTKRKTTTASMRSDICTALREVIRIADQEAPRLFLSIRAVYQHIIDILRDLNVAKFFCATYCQLLCEILGVDGYCSMIRRQNFSDYLKILTYFISNSSQFSSVDQIQNARALLVVLRAYPFDMTEHLPKVFRSLLQILKLNDTLEDSRQTLFVLTALNHVCLTNSLNAGVQFLAIGEQLSPQILSLLARTRDPNIREQTLLFFKLQAQLHINFCGDVSDVHGIFTEPTAAKGILETLADFLGNQRLPKGKIDERCMEVGSTGYMYDLISEVSMILADIGLPLNADGAGGRLSEEPPHKRKRKSDIGTELCQNGWEFVALNLSRAIERSSECVLMWLQATATMVEKHGPKMPLIVAEKLFSQLSGATLSSERHDVSAWTLKCLRQLAMCNHSLESGRGFSWETVWHTVLKRLSFPLPSFVVTEGFCLMEAILCCDLIEKQVIHSKQDMIWALPAYKEDGPAPSAAFSFLAEFLRRFELQDGTRAQDAPSLRCFLLRRVISAASSPVSTTKQPIPDGCSLAPAVIASLLVGLVHPGPVLEAAAKCFASEAPTAPYNFGDRDLPSSVKHDHISKEEISFYLDQLEVHHHIFSPGHATLFGPMAASAPVTTSIFKDAVPDQAQPSNAMSVRERLDTQKKLVTLLEEVAAAITEETQAVLSRKKKTLGVDTHRLCLNQCRLHNFIGVLALFFGFVRSAPAVCDELASYLPKVILELMQHAVQGLSYFLTDTRKLQLFVFPTLKGVIAFASLHLPAKLSNPLLTVVNILIGFLESQDKLLTRESTVRIASTDSAGVVDLTSEFDLCMDEDDTAELTSVAAVYSHDCALLAVECLALLTKVHSVEVTQITGSLVALLKHPSSPAIKFATIHCLLSQPSVRYAKDILTQVENILLAAEFSSSAHNRSELLRIVRTLAERVLRSIQGSGTKQPSESLKTLDNIVSVFSELWRGGKLNWHTRRELCGCASALLVSDVDRFDGLSSVLLDLLEDPDFRVRFFASGTVSQLFSIYNEEEMIFADVFSHTKNLLTAESTQEERVTALLCLANIGAVSQVVEPRVMLELYSEASNPDVTELVSRLLDCMAAFLGYGTAGGLIEAHLQYIVDKWISGGNHKRGLEDFPVQLCDCSTVSEFVCKYTNIVLPHAVYSMDSSCFKYVAEVAGLNGTALVSKHIPAVFVYTFPLYYSDHRRAESIFETFLPEHAPNLVLTKQIRANMDEILVLLIDAASLTSNPVPPDHSVKSIEQVLSHISGKQTVLEFLQRKRGRVQGILLHLRVKFHSHAHTTPKLRALQSTEVLINILKQAVATPNIIRTVVHFLLEAVSSQRPGVHSLACELLLQVCKSCVEFGGAEELGQYLNQIVCTLVPFVATQPLANSILSYLIIEAGNRLGKFIGELDPLPDVPELSSIIERWEYFNEHVGNDSDLLRELKRFRRVASSSAAAASSFHETGLARLTAFCKDSKSRLLNFVEVNKEGRDLLSSLVWELIRLCSPQRSSEQVRLQAAKCLGELGVMNPYAIAFSSTDMSFSLASDEVLAAVTKLIARKKSASVSHDSSLLLRAICTALYSLNTHQVDPSIETVVAATSALRKVLGTKEGAQVLATLQKVDERSYNYLHPWASSSSASVDHQPSSQLTQDPLDVILMDDDIWNPTLAEYPVWLRTLTERLASTLPSHYQALRICAPMCALKLSFAEAVFPYVLACVLLCNGVGEANRIGVLLDKFVLSEANDSIAATQYFLTVLNFLRDEASLRGQPTFTSSDMKKLRSKRKEETVTPFWESILWPRVSLLSTAAAAQRCAAFLTSVLFVEAWHDQQRGELALTRSITTEDKRARQLLLVAYSSINEPDAILGLSHQFDMLSQIKVAEHEGQWESVAHTYDSLLSLEGDHFNSNSISTSGGVEASRLRKEQGLVSALQRSGFGYMTNLFLKGFSARFPNQFLHLSDAQFEHYWRSCNWTLDPEQWQLLDSEQTGFHKALHSGLRALSEVDENAMRNSLRTARLGLARDLQSTSLESTKFVHPVLVKLHMLEELENAWCLFKSDSMTDSLESSQLSAMELGSTDEKARWQRQLSFLSSNSFDEIEPLLALRSTVLSIAGCSDELQSHLRNVAKLARSSGRLQIAAHASFRLERMSRGEAGAIRAHWEQCKLLWSKGEHSRAVSAAEALLDVANEVDTWADPFLADLRYAISKWMASSGSAGLQGKISELVKEALLDYMKVGDKQKLCACHYTLARYLDGLYQGMRTKMSSPEWQASLRLRRQKEAEYNLCRERVKTMEKGSSERNHLEITLVQIRRSLDVERLEGRKLREELASNLHESVRHYLYCLVNGGKHDSTAVFRVCSLWFGNSDDKHVNELVNSHIMSIPSFKWVTLIYQIASRMTAGEAPFQLVLKALIERIAIDHPHHSLFQLFALSNADKVQSKVRDQYRMDDGKRTAASTLLAELRLSEVGHIVKAMEPLVNQYIKVALLSLSREATNGVDELPLPLGLRKLKDLVDVPVATATLALQPSTNYESMVTVHSFSAVMKLVGGVHLPRVAVCVGSDGQSYRQLIKGNDDLRQDAVMQQMFHMVNTLLKADTETRKRCLKIRTYKVVPLSPVTGILEWVENTTPLSDYLVGRGRKIYDGAHLRYRPGDMLSIACRNRMAKAKDKQEAFAEVTEKFKPVFHHFFLEHYKQPADWFEKRIDYTRSMASNSIVGYIVGLGDRHPSNILIDTTSAELVHIDLGVAFEQGKMLRIPETVPFRLTRDLVDGMGATGTEGVYRRCCEETMRVLREQHEALLTIVEVFVHDPLYRWALSPLRALALQRAEDDGDQSSALPESSDEVGAGDAEKTLSRVRQKLQGVEYGGVTSVEEQIALLIDEAQDPARLAHIFFGWKAWV